MVIRFVFFCFIGWNLFDPRSKREDIAVITQLYKI